MQRTLLVGLLILLVGACGGQNIDFSAIPELEQTDLADLEQRLATSEKPVVVNVWASWCVPCRSEAPLFKEAAQSVEGSVLFIGLNVRDDQEGARSFIAEFFPDAPLLHLFDSGGDVPISLGGSRGVPLTFFFAPGGELVNLHSGVIDERTLALQIDEILNR